MAAHQEPSDAGHCTQCRSLDGGWTPQRRCNDTNDSNGPHTKCSEPSLTPEQEAFWRRVRHLPGVRLRDAAGRNNLWPSRSYVFRPIQFVIHTCPCAYP